MNLRGIFPPIPTPFDGRDVLDEAALRANVRRWAGSRLAGLVVLGSNGEAPQLDDDEADRTIAIVREEWPGGRTLIAGTARESTRGTVAATRRAARAGVDAVLVRTPSFFKRQMTTEALVAHYRHVADEAPVPVILYNFTAVTGITLLPDAVEALATHPNIAGVKESGSDMAQLGQYIDRTPDDFAVLAGSAPTLYAALCLGAVGGVLALAAVVPELVVELYEAARQQRHTDARMLQKRLTPLARLVGTLHGVPGLKAALDAAGYAGGPPRPPLQAASSQVRDTIAREVDALTRDRIRVE